MKVSTSVKIDSEQYEALRKLAEQNERPIAAELRRAVRLYLKGVLK